MNGRDTRSLARSERAYGAVLALYPKGFRTHYSREMRLAWRQLCRDAYRRKGGFGLAAAWIGELPALLTGALFERNAVMARTVAAVGRVRSFKAIMVVTAAVLIGFGISLFCAGASMVLAYGLVEQVPDRTTPEAWSTLLPAQLMAQALGVALIGLGGLTLGARASIRTRVGIGLSGALGGAHALLALAFLLTFVQYPSVLALVTTAVAAALGIVYLCFWFTETVTWDTETQRSAEHAAAGS